MGNGEGGRFAPGNQQWKKRKRNGPQRTAELEHLQTVIDANVSPEAVAAAWKRIATAIEHGGRGWMDAFKLYLDRRYGKPNVSQDIDITSGGEPIKGYVVVSPDDWPDDTT